ncbi:probable ADP-ribosylation factor GTPase-activating protein AGD14 [Cajanus cajan]|uniref:probable ADP-ribosylation factor GTPase-activating protein AGD14 n=1 Tax=Cajanus cajan TaxID=3821 RepID=UPI00098D8B50|nr:probable ADP-ribosylation factor GTPase-activating protein AGD14 [Cajanus cajan]XP_020220171.1 probable ADP-ribosylation factor GTPase-activating protein AGD14 [Cajanus cajan]
MASRLKEDEKNERIIRGLLKLTPNRRCINCNSLGPQYVCTNFWTFVCISCSGIHREFTHRVKSISMAKFTAQEVSALQEGGNQHAKEIYFKEWDPQHHSLPDSSNINRLRDFIKHVYVDRRFTGDRTYDKPPRAKGDKDDENKRMETYPGGSKSPPYDYSDRSSPGGRSPGYDQENRQYGDYKRSPGRPPIVNDWRREDRFGDGRKFEDNRISDGNHKLESHSPEQTRDLGSSSPPVARPVREILGENVVPLRISEPPKTNGGQAANGSALTQRTASSSSLASSNGTAVEVKLETIKSLIDFDDDPEPPAAPAIPQAQQPNVAQLGIPANSNDNNWASFDVAPEAKASQAPSNVNPLESVLTQLSVPVSLPSQVSGAQGPVWGSALTITASGASIVGGFSTFPASGASVTSGLTTSTLNNAGQWASLQYQQHQPLFTAAGSQPTIQQSTPPIGGALNNQPWTVPLVQGHSSTPMPHASHLVPKPANGAKSTVVLQPSTVDTKSSGRSELPEDLFTVKYSSFPARVPGWEMVPPPSTGISIQYNNMMPMPSFPQQSKSTNPFDISNEPTPFQAPTFPSMSSLQGALPSVTPSATIHPSNMGNQPLAWNPPSSSSYVSMPPPQAQTLAPVMGPGAYMGQQMATNMPMQRHQGTGNFATEGNAFGFSNPDQQQLTGRLYTAATPNTFHAGGNPFG